MLRYLKGAQDYGIHYTRDITRLGLRNQKLNTLYALSDSDFAGCSEAARSTSGSIILIISEHRSNFLVFCSSDNEGTMHSYG